MAQIHYLICFDTETEKWSSADEKVGLLLRKLNGME